MRISRRGLVVIAALAALVVGVLIWRGREQGTTSSAGKNTAERGVVANRATDLRTGAPSWFGQRGVAGRRIAGVVITADGAPVRGATVRIASRVSMSGAGSEPSAITDGAGRFDFGPQPATEYVVVAESAKLTGAFRQIDLRDATASPPPDQLRLVLHACDASIHGTIRDSGGGPVPGALVSRAAGAVMTKAGAVADDKGEYELCVPPGGARVMVTADGYATIADRVNVFGRTRHDFALMPGTTVVGQVVRADDRSPVPGAIVELRPEAPRTDVMLYASSDQDGRFQFEGVAPGRSKVSAVAERLASARPVEVIAEVGIAPQDVICEVTATLTIAGKVIELGSGKGIAGTSVYMVPRENLERRPLEAITQADGSFVVDRVFPDEYQAGLPAEGPRDGERPTIKVVDADVTGVVLEMEARASISGRVVHGGKPVDGATVRSAGSAGYKWTQTDHEGRYTLLDLPAGEHTTYAESHRVGAFTNGPSVTLAKGEHKTGVEISLDLSGSIAGIVVDQNDAPVGGVFLSFSLLRGKDFGAATTADDGTFTTRSLSGGGDYVFEVRQRDGSPLIYPPVTGKRFTPITVRDGQSHVTGVRIKIRVERLAIAGRVTDAAGQPVVDVTVRATPSDGWGYRIPTAISDETGAFTIRDLSAGTYDLHASAARADARLAKVAAGRTDIVLRLAEHGRIDGTLEGFTEPPSVAAFRRDQRGSPYRAVVSGTSFQLRNMTPGEYRIVATSSTQRADAELSVAPGATQKVTLRVREVGVIEGTVIDAKTRAPVAEMYCANSVAGMAGSPNADTAMSGPTGAFRLERAPVGLNKIYCGAGGSSGTAEVTVTAGQVARVEVVATARLKVVRGHAGLTLETQLREVMVKAVEPGGPAARAGVVVGDVLLKVDDRAVERWDEDGAMYSIEMRPIDTPVKLTLERADKQVTVLLTLVAAP